MKTEAAILWGQHEEWSIEEVELDPPRRGEAPGRVAEERAPRGGVVDADDLGYEQRGAGRFRYARLSVVLHRRALQNSACECEHGVDACARPVRGADRPDRLEILAQRRAAVVA